MTITKEEVKATFKGDGKGIAKAMTQYFSEKMAERKIKPLEFYKSGDQIGGKEDIVAVAEQIFLV